MKQIIVSAGRILLCISGSIALTYILDYLLGEIIVYCYMHNNGIVVRSELSEDMGFGMLTFFASLLSAPIFFIGLFLFFCKKTETILKKYT